MIVRKLAEAMRQQNWFTVVLEILIVVIGLFIGLQVDDWNQRRIDRSTEAAYLRELLEDFEANRASLEKTSQRLETILRNMNALLGQSVLEEPTGRSLNSTTRLSGLKTCRRSLPSYAPTST
jgi:hypothetical protein